MSGTAVQQDVCRNAKIKQGVVVLWSIGMISSQFVWQIQESKTVAHHSCSNQLQVPEMVEVVSISGPRFLGASRQMIFALLARQDDIISSDRICENRT